jgi:hypothetical protein
VSPLSHGIVAFSGWPLNALRRDDNYEKPVGKNTREKVFAENRRISRRKREFVFVAEQKTTENAYIDVLEKVPDPRKPRENGPF